MDYLPLFLDLRGRPCVVVGGGQVAARKLGLLLRAGARVTVVAPQLCAEIEQRAQAAELAVVRRPFAAADVASAAFVIAASDDESVNDAVAIAARTHHVLVNVVDRPRSGTVIMPSIVDRSPVVIAVGTGGRAPILARMLRAKLESMIPRAYGDLADVLGSLRERVRDALPDPLPRRRFWERALDGPAAELLFAGRRADAVRALEQELATDTTVTTSGAVYLIGTGPGDPDLLTFRALRLMQQADVVIFDRLVGDGIVDLCRRDAERIFVGKQAGDHSYDQSEINQLLVTLARGGKRVARLKGGDPFIFGRGGEEIEELAAAGLEFQIVPGITAALGCAAYAGIPLTHREHAHSCVFITGHAPEQQAARDWQALVRSQQTIVVYMGAATLDYTAKRLIEAGLAPSTPLALIERGTLAEQRVAVGTLDQAADLAQRSAARPPLLAIIGSVVRLRDKLAWFGRERCAAGSEP